MVNQSDSTTLTLDPQGRVLLPKPLRQRLGLKPGDRLVALVEEGQLILLPWETVEAELWCEVVGLEGSLAEELLTERRQEAVRDA